MIKFRKCLSVIGLATTCILALPILGLIILTLLFALGLFCIPFILFAMIHPDFTLDNIQ